MSEGTLPAATESEADQLRLLLEAEKRKVVEAQRMVALGRLVAGIVHEIKTPIGSILSNNDVILRSFGNLERLLGSAQQANEAPPAKALDILATMKSLAEVDKIACERISAIIRSLKTFARVDDRALRKADLNELVLDALKLSGCEFRRRVTFETDLRELPEVECHPSLMSQVFLNLLVNAGQAICGEGKVTIRTRLEDGTAHISIADTGSGIKPEHRARIFGAGFSTKPIGEGTGLGLAITREIVEDTHHGSIDFESEVGVGTVFHVRIPIRQSHDSPE